MAKAKRVSGIRCDRSTAFNARLVIQTRLEEMLAFAPWVDDPANVEEIHNLRIAAKRLRYSLELFRFALPSGTNSLINEVKEIQEHIGDLHDADVMIERMISISRDNAEQRTQKLLDIAMNRERGTVAQRQQRIRSSTTSPRGQRDDAALFTLVALRSEDRIVAYEAFITAWRRMMDSDFEGRLRTHLDDAVAEAEAAAEQQSGQHDAD